MATYLALSTLAVPRIANAVETCEPDKVSLDDTCLAIHCNGRRADDWFFSDLSVSVETRRAWLSMVQTAMLTGKIIEVDNQGDRFVWLQLNK